MVSRTTSIYPSALDMYARAAKYVAQDAGAKNSREIAITTSDDHPAARAVAMSREGTISVATDEAKRLQPLVALATSKSFDALTAEQQKDLQFRTFTALHEASHVTGPAMPETSPDSKLDTMWEEGLASLNARRLVPSFLQKNFKATAVQATPISDITYGGIAQRITELMALTGRDADTSAYNKAITTLAEQTPWRDRSTWIAREIARKQLGVTLPDATLAPLLAYIQGYVNRPTSGTGLIESTLQDIQKSIQ